MQMLIFIKPISASSILFGMFAECGGLKSRAELVESIQCVADTPPQPGAMRGVEPLFTAEVNKAVFLQMAC